MYLEQKLAVSFEIKEYIFVFVYVFPNFLFQNKSYIKI